MVLGQRYHPIEALPPKGPDESFAERIRLRAPNGCRDDLKSEVSERLIESGGKDCVVVVEDEPVDMVRRYSFAHLLESPGCGRTGSHVEVNNSARSVFHDHHNRAAIGLDLSGRSWLIMQIGLPGEAISPVGVVPGRNARVEEELPVGVELREATDRTPS